MQSARLSGYIQFAGDGKQPAYLPVQQPDGLGNQESDDYTACGTCYHVKRVMDADINSGKGVQ